MINVTDNVREVLSFTDRMSSQFHFAVAKALTDVAREAARSMPAQAQQELDDPTPFTLQGFFSTPAKKEALQSVVGIKDVQAQYLWYQVEGGQRRPKRKALRLPTAIDLDAYGNVPKGVIGQLVARAKAGKRATKRQAERFGVSRAVDLFYGDPGDDRPAGLYKRVQAGKEQRLVPLIVFPQQSASYDKAFDFYGAAKRTVRARFEPLLRRAWADAKRTARR